MKVRTIPSGWLRQNGRRFDPGPYLSGAIEAKVRLERLACRKDRLADLTAGHEGGIYNGPHFSRRFVTDPRYGVPFLGSASMLRADLSNLPLLRKKDAYSPKLVHLRVRTGMTLISCSGTIGRMVYARPDMDGMWSSQDIMKVVPDPEKVPPGYLYAFLSSKYGVPLVTSGTYGSIIQHIEPEHIADLPVPRLGDDLEQRVHELVEEAAVLLTTYQRGIRGATALFFDSVGLADLSDAEWHSRGPDLGFSQRFPKVRSFRALNYNPRFQALCATIKGGPWKPLGDICLRGTLKRGGRFKRIDADPEYAYQLVGQKQLFWLCPIGRWVARWALKDVLVEPGTILVAAQGTLGESELYCRAEFAWGPSCRLAYSEHILRVVADENIMPRGCLYAFMRSETAFRMLRSISFGTKLQDHHPAFLRELPVPLPPQEKQEQVHEMIVDAYRDRHKAVALLAEATGLVERTIEEAT